MALPNLRLPSIENRRIPPSLAEINFAQGRGACPFPIDGIVIHCTEGDAVSVRDWFRNPRANRGSPSEVSAHYMVRRDGGVEQFVDEADRAFHAGIIVAPTNPLAIARYRSGGWTPNNWTIGIELETVDDTQDLSSVQREASYVLLADIVVRRRIPVNRTHFIAHREIRQTKTCPGSISVDRIVSDLRDRLGERFVTPDSADTIA